MNFQDFLDQHPSYARLYDRLAAASPASAGAARAAVEIHGRRLARATKDIFDFLEAAGPRRYEELYLHRLAYLTELQTRFARNPSWETLGDPGASVSTDEYNTSLLLSIIFTHHRFEIMRQLQLYADLLRGPEAGRLAAVGIGSGYELKLLAAKLPDWHLEGYDQNAESRQWATRLLRHFLPAAQPDLRESFPLENPASEWHGSYDAIVLCELLEHLPDPVAALASVRDCLKSSGYAFVTMAVNLAQEDHIFLYPDLATCRAQILAAGLKIVHEASIPVLLSAAGLDAGEAAFSAGNFIAVVTSP